MERSVASRHLLAIHNHAGAINLTLEQTESLVVVLPRGGTVTAGTIGSEGKTLTQLRLNKTPILTYYVDVDTQLTFELSSIGTKYGGAATHIPKYSIIEAAALNEAATIQDITIPHLWAAIYALFTQYYTQEYIPLALTSVVNEEELRRYLLISGLGRLHHQGGGKADIHENIIFLSNAAFWQGAGTTGYHGYGWLLSPTPAFPSIPSFTRSESVITSHPLRPPKPAEGEILYRRYCAAIGQNLEITAFDLHGPRGQDGLTRHMAAFHKWHNDERINSAWGERGSLDAHKEYVERLLRDPGVIPCVMSWDGELMGYIEIVWLKEDHCAQYYPPDTIVGDWERGIHVLVGESKFLGGGRAEVWFRSIVHYIFLADARTERVSSEPKESNIAMTKLGLKSSFHPHTTIDFPYKRSVLMLASRERFFKSNRLC